MAWPVPQRPSLVLIAAAAVVGAAGCGGQGDHLERAAKCLREGNARAHPPPRVLSNPLGESGWRVRTFAVGSNDLVLVAAGSDAGARQARARLARARDTVDPTKPSPQLRGRLVYSWAERPSPSAQALVRRCVG